MDPNERLVIDDGFNEVAWNCNLCHADVNRYWQNPYVTGLSGSTTSWYQTVFGMVDTRASNIDCYAKAYDQWIAHKNDTQFDLWQFDLTRSQWEINFDKYNKYQQKISQKFFEKTSNGNGSLIFTADSIVRVNVTVGPWFNPGFLWTFKNAYLTNGGGKTAMDFFFNEKNGAFNSIMTGMVVMSNIATNSTFYWNDGSSSSGSSWSHFPLNPYIFAWVIKKMPLQAEC
jgi:hypothetical protein